MDEYPIMIIRIINRINFGFERGWGLEWENVEPFFMNYQFKEQNLILVDLIKEKDRKFQWLQFESTSKMGLT